VCRCSAGVLAVNLTAPVVSADTSPPTHRKPMYGSCVSAVLSNGGSRFVCGAPITKALACEVLVLPEFEVTRNPRAAPANHLCRLALFGGTIMRFGPYPYAPAFIDQIAENRCGHYALGKKDEKVPLLFHKKYVGRSDHCLRTELKKYLDRGYDVFWFDFDLTPVLAFTSECLLFHRLQVTGLDNENHPDLPDAKDLPPGIDLKCWICGHPHKQ